MTLRPLPSRQTTSDAGRAPAAPPDPASRSPEPWVFVVQRIGAGAVALVIGVFGVLGFVGGLGFFSTEGEPVLGMSSNGLLSTVSVVTAVVLLAAAARSPRIASTVMIGVGTLFLLSALANLAVLESRFNVLAFSMANVVFSLCAGLVLLTLGAYGRVSGNLPADSPYRREGDGDDGPDTSQQLPETPAERAAEQAMREAERAVAEHRATPDQERRVAAMAEVRSRADRRAVWTSFDRTPLR